MNFINALQSGKLLPARVVKTMRTPRTDLGVTEYGYGVVLWRGRGIWGHAGDLPGTAVDLEVLEKPNVIALVLSNYSGVNDPIRRRIAYLWGIPAK